MWLPLSLRNARHRLVDQAQNMLIEDAKVLKGAISREVHRALRTQFLRRPSAGPATVVRQGNGQPLGGPQGPQGGTIMSPAIQSGYSRGGSLGDRVDTLGLGYNTVSRTGHACFIDLACGSSLDCSTTT